MIKNRFDSVESTFRAAGQTSAVSLIEFQAHETVRVASVVSTNQRSQLAVNGAAIIAAIEVTRST